MKSQTPRHGPSVTGVVTGYRIVAVTDDEIVGRPVTQYEAACDECTWHAGTMWEARDSAFADLHDHGTKHHLEHEGWWRAFGKLAVEKPQ